MMRQPPLRPLWGRRPYIGAVALLWGWVACAAVDPVLTLDSARAPVGGTVTLTVKLEGGTPDYAGLHVVFALPAGINWTSATAAPGRTGFLVSESTYESGGQRYAAVIGLAPTVSFGEDGALIRINLAIDSMAPLGLHAVQMIQSAISDAGGKSLISHAKTKGFVTVISGAEPVLALGSDLIAPGGSAVLPLTISGGETGYTGLQMELDLPEGISCTAVAPAAGLQGFTLVSNVYAGESGQKLGLIAYSDTAGFGIDSTLCNIEFQADAATPPGPAAIQMANSLIASSSGLNPVTHTATSGTLTVTGEAPETRVADTDGDGMPDAYEDEYPDALDPMAYDAKEDVDGDGLSNLKEYLGGSSPVDAMDPVAVIFVDGALGSDTLGTGGALSPYQTIQYAIDNSNAASESVRILIQPGDYPEGYLALTDNIILSGAADGVTVLGAVTGAPNCVIEDLDIVATSDASPLVLIADGPMLLKNVVLDGADFAPDTGLEIGPDAVQGTVLDRVILSGFGTGLWISGAIPRVRRCIFENFTNAGIVVEDSAEETEDTGGLGDLTSAKSGWNTFQNYDSAQYAVLNETGTGLKMQNNDWGVYTYDEIKTKVHLSDGYDVSPGDVVPFAAKSAGILAGSIYCAVVETNSEKRLLTASVTLSGTAYAPVTENENGVYAFPAVPPGLYSLSVTASAYATAATSATVPNSAEAVLTVALTAQNTNPPGEGENGSVNDSEGESVNTQGEGEGESNPNSKPHRFLFCGDSTGGGAPWRGDILLVTATVAGILTTRRKWSCMTRKMFSSATSIHPNPDDYPVRVGSRGPRSRGRRLWLLEARIALAERGRNGHAPHRPWYRGRATRGRASDGTS